MRCFFLHSVSVLSGQNLAYVTVYSLQLWQPIADRIVMV
jgi:hypothetical protein